VVPIIGSSANRSLSGSKYRLADVEQEILAGADLVIDGGATRYSHPGGMGSTIVELPSYRVLRRGILLDEICHSIESRTGRRVLKDLPC